MSQLEIIRIKSVIRAVFLLFCFCVFTDLSHAAGPTYISYFVDNPNTWTKENSPYIVQNHVVVKAPLTIEAGTVIKFASSLADLDIKNDFYVNGTREAPVVFTSIHDDSDGYDSDNSSQNPQMGDWSSITFNPSQDYEMKIKYAEVKYSSFGVHIIPSSSQTKDISVKNSRFRKNGRGILVGNAEPRIENNLITENTVGIRINSLSSKKTKATNNSIFGNGTGAWATSSLYPQANLLEAEYNWWGDKSGPQNENNPEGKGNSVKGQITFNPWLEEDPLQNPDPVIIIPGIMGSWEKRGKWQIDPIFHTYDDLRSAFLTSGYYEKEKNYFEFPYQWRDSNKVNAINLRAKIQEIKEKTGRPKVDIVAHSMGGLLAREYIESDYYEDDVDQLITIGTPHLGAPKTYIKWEAGAFFADIFELAGKKFFEHEAKENGYDSIFHYIRGRPIESVRELLPVYDYLWDDNGTDYDLRVGYPENYPRNEFLENLNDVERIKALEDVEFAKIMGKKDDVESTISGYNVVNADMGELWQHGYPHGFEIPVISDQGLRTGDGDVTVPLYSAEALEIPDNGKIYLKSNHNALPTDAQQNILEILTGKRPENKIDEWQIDDILAGFVFSPVDIQIISPSGKRLGKDFEIGGEFDEIPGAYYTGFNTNTEFFVIPNPEDGEYKILTQGTGEGEYKIEMVKITDNPDDPDNSKESSATIEAETQIDKIQEVKVEVADDEIIYNPDITPPTITILSPEEIDYTNDRILNINYSVEDAESGVASESWQIEKDGQVLNWPKENIDLSLEHLGGYILKVSAIDKASNLVDKKAEFRITTNINAIQNNLTHYFNLGLVKKEIAYRYLDRELKNLEKLFNLLEKTKNSYLKPEPKQKAITALEKIINADINRLIKQIKRKSPRWIDTKAVEFLIEDLNYIKLL